MSALQAVSGQIESIPGYGVAMDAWGDFAGEHLDTKGEYRNLVIRNPYYVKKPNGGQTRRKPPEGLSDHDRELWKQIIKKAWTHDRCFFGWFWMDIGVGTAPLAALIPVIGPVCMYAVHGRIISIADDLRVPVDLHAKMAGNILFDFIISLCPILGSIFCWLNACSTRNAALIDTFLRKRSRQEAEQRGPFELVDNRQYTQHERQLAAQRQQAAPAAQGQRPGQPAQAISQPAPVRTQAGRPQVQAVPPTVQHQNARQDYSRQKPPRSGQTGQMESGVM